MAERPKWFRGVIQGDRQRGAPATKAESTLKQLTSAPTVGSRLEAGVAPKIADAADPEDLLLFTFEGGKEGSGDAKDTEGASEAAKETALVGLYLEISREPPANFRARVRQDKVAEAAGGVISWSVDAFLKYLNGPIWTTPSFTMAVFNEIKERIGLGNMSPRK